jgi:hypothetical protein
LLHRREQERFMAGLVAAAEALASDALAEVAASQEQPAQPKPQPW